MKDSVNSSAGAEGLLAALEANLSQHPRFGNPERILKRRFSVYRLALAALVDGGGEAEQLRSALRSLPERAQARFLGDPLVRILLNGALLGSPELATGNWASILRAGQEATADCGPLERAARPVARLAAPAQGVWLWRGDELPGEAPDVVSRFKALSAQALAPELAGGRMRWAMPGTRQLVALGDACALLEAHAPQLWRSCAAHLECLAIVRFERGDADESSKVKSLSDPRIPGITFLSERLFGEPWSLAESLLHEALHHKLFDLWLTHSILGSSADSHGGVHICIPWRPPGPAAEWSTARALGAFHVYVHLGLLYVRRLAAQASSPSSQSAGAERRLANIFCRTRYLGRRLEEDAAAELGGDGRALVSWLIAAALAMQRIAEHMGVAKERVSG